MAQEPLPRPTARDARALAELIESEPDASVTARDLASALQARPALLEIQFIAEAAYLFKIYSNKVWAAQHSGLALRGEDELSRIAAQGQSSLRLMAASDGDWHYQAFTDPNMTRLVACISVAKKDASPGRGD
jgi:hypothetical protein